MWMELVLFRVCDYIWSTNHLKSKHTCVLIYIHYLFITITKCGYNSFCFLPWGWWSGLLSILHQLYWNSINTRGGNAFPILASHSKLVFCPTFWRQTASLWLCFKSFTQPTKLNIEVQKPLDLPLYDKLLVCLCSYRYSSMFHLFLNCSGSQSII